MKTVSIKETSPDIWHVTVDGEVLEGSIGSDRRRARNVAVLMVEIEEREADRDGRHVEMEMADEIVLPYPPKARAV